MDSVGPTSFFTMSKGLGVVTLMVLLVSDSTAEISLSQPPDVSTASGGNIEIYCALSGVVLGNANIDWYQQKSENDPPRLTMYHNTDTLYRASGVPARFSGKSNVAANTRYLIISPVQVEDDAHYYCAVWVGSTSTFYFGSGTKLTISSRTMSSPSVSLLPPADKQVAEGQVATLVCLINNFFPASVEVSWSMDDEAVKSGVQTTRAVRDTDQTYSLSSYLTLSTSEWNSHEKYTCGVTHESLGFQLTRSIQRSGCV
ncbi:immunoglobulin lambda-1 light chain-like [Narcine bancroftii]|uniref:immunoglobulin lambda-1 light chain-like n=1 Tax=Narcine bancroftii TaxID=1343680 RepID=UPI0038312C23